VRIWVRRKNGGEEGQRPHHHRRQKKNTSHNHVIITVFLMVAQAVINKYHIKYKISRIYQPHNISSPPPPSYWVLDANKTFIVVKACKHLNLNVDVQLLLQTNKSI